MQTKRRRVALAVIGAMAFAGLTNLQAAHTQDTPARSATVTIETEDGKQEFDVDPDQVASLISQGGGNNHVIVAHVGPDGQLITDSGDPNMLRMLHGRGLLGAVPGLPLMGGQDIIDPGQSYLAPLLKREDVRAQLYITPRQREALDSVEKSHQESVNKHLKQITQLMGDEVKGKTLAEIREAVEAHAARMDEQIRQQTEESDKKLASILTPSQRKRLEELDKQWRGPLAMGVKDVAQQAQLTQPQAPVVTGLLNQYRTEVSSRLKFGSPSIQKTQTAAKGKGASVAALSPQEREAKIEQVHKELEKARQTLGEKALNSLSAPQRMQWAALTGKPFIFRAN